LRNNPENTGQVQAWPGSKTPQLRAASPASSAFRPATLAGNRQAQQLGWLPTPQPGNPHWEARPAIRLSSWAASSE